MAKLVALYKNDNEFRCLEQGFF